MSARQTIDPGWWDTDQLDGIPMRHVLAERDIKSLFTFLHRRGWSWATIAQATDIGEQRVREIAGGKRRIENYDVYVRVAVGLNIPRDYLGVGMRPIDEPAVTPIAVAGDAVRSVPGGLAMTMRTVIERATPAEAAEDSKPDLQRFESQVMRAWAGRRHAGPHETNLILVAGFAGSGKTECWLLHRCETANAHLEVVWIGADIETMRTYLQKRDAARDSWKLNHWDEYLASIDLEMRPDLPHFYVDNSLGSAVRLADEARRVSEWISP